MLQTAPHRYIFKLLLTLTVDRLSITTTAMTIPMNYVSMNYMKSVISTRVLSTWLTACRAPWCALHRRRQHFTSQQAAAHGSTWKEWAYLMRAFSHIGRYCLTPKSLLSTYLTCHSSAIYTCKVTCLPCMLFTCLFLLPHVNYALNYILVQVVDKSYFEMAPHKLYSTLHAEMRYLLPFSHRSSFGGYGH